MKEKKYQPAVNKLPFDGKRAKKKKQTHDETIYEPEQREKSILVYIQQYIYIIWQARKSTMLLTVVLGSERECCLFVNEHPAEKMKKRELFRFFIAIRYNLPRKEKSNKQTNKSTMPIWRRKIEMNDLLCATLTFLLKLLSALYSKSKTETGDLSFSSN